MTKKGDETPSIRADQIVATVDGGFEHFVGSDEALIAGGILPLWVRIPRAYLELASWRLGDYFCTAHRPKAEDLSAVWVTRRNIPFGSDPATVWAAYAADLKSDLPSLSTRAKNDTRFQEFMSKAAGG